MNRIRLWALASALVLLFGGTQSTQAASVVLAIDSSQSTLDLKIAMAGGRATGSVTTTLTGSVNTDISIGTVGPDLYTDLLRILSADVNLSDASLTVNLGQLGTVPSALLGVGFNLAGGPFAPTSLGSPGVSLYDPGGMIATLDQGLITFRSTGAVGGVIEAGTFNFVTDPHQVEISSAPSALQATLAQGSQQRGITLLIPISGTTTITSDLQDLGIDVTATLTGQIVATGLIVPEPATLGLLALGVCGLAPMLRRKLHKPA